MDPGRDPRRGSRAALSRLRRSLRRWLRPPRTLRPTRAGWVFFALALGVGFGALNTGNNLLYLVLSLMLAFLVLSGILSESALRGIHVRRHLPAELFAEADHRVHLEIHNDQRRVPSFALAVEDTSVSATGGAAGAGDSRPPAPTATHVGRVFALQVRPGAREHRHYRLRPLRRGPLRFEAFRVSTRFPFGLFLKSRVIEAPAETLVFPAVDPVHPAAGAGDARESGRVSTSLGGGPAVSGLRDFAPGDPPRRIHWRSSVRRGQLVAREVEDERTLEHEVRLRTRGIAAQRFESRVRRAASEVVALLEAGIRVGLRTDDTALPAGGGARHRARLLSLLARVEPAQVEPEVEDPA